MRGLCCSGRGLGSTTAACLSWKRPSRWTKAVAAGHAVVGAAPGHEVQLAELACRPTVHEVLHQCGDGRGGARPGEELRLGNQVRVLGRWGWGPCPTAATPTGRSAQNRRVSATTAA